jgi:urease accessory protein
MTSRIIRRALPVVAIAIPATVHAHPGHGVLEFSAGAFHPVLGLDHLAAMLAVGLLAAQLGGRARMALPVAFITALAIGALAGVAGLAIPGLEHGLAFSVLALGAIVALAARLPLAAAATIVALSGVLHGMAHGIEIPADASGIVFGLGFLTSSAALHLAGITLGSALIRTSRPVAIRYAGAIASLTALGMFLR